MKSSRVLREVVGLRWLALLGLLLVVGCGDTSDATDPAPDTQVHGQPDATDPEPDAGTDPGPDATDPEPDPDTHAPPASTEGLVAQLAGPLTFDSRQYFAGHGAAYSATEPVGTLYLLHGLGASGCDFLDRYYPAQFVLEALERGYLVVLPESAAQGGSCRYESDTPPFRLGEIWIDSDLDYLDALHTDAIVAHYPELAEAPIFVAGMSAGGGVSPGFAQAAHRDLFDGVAVFSNNATVIGQNPSDPYDVPTFFIYGENDNTTKDLTMVLTLMETLGVPWAFELNDAEPVTAAPFETALGVSEAQAAALVEALLADSRVTDGDGYLISGGFDPNGGKVGAPIDPWEDAISGLLPPNVSFLYKEAILDVLRELDGAHFMPDEFNGQIFDFFEASRTDGDLRDDTGQPMPCPIDAMEDNDEIALGDAIPSVDDAIAACTDDQDVLHQRLHACPNDDDLYEVTANSAQTLLVAIASGESLAVTVVKPANGAVVDSQTGEGPLSFDVPAGTHLIKVEVGTDDTSQGLGIAYSLDLE